MNITFDLETLGDGYNAPIVQIGAVKFNDEGKTDATFLRTINIEKLSRYDFKTDYSTIKWWLNQEDAAIKSVFAVEDEQDLRQSLREFQEWVGKSSNYVYWTHATFDPPILINNFRKVGLPDFIPFRLHRDIRTLIYFTGTMETTRKGVHHNALDDAIYQAEYISKGILKIQKHLKETL